MELQAKQRLLAAGIKKFNTKKTASVCENLIKEFIDQSFPKRFEAVQSAEVLGDAILAQLKKISGDFRLIPVNAYKYKNDSYQLSFDFSLFTRDAVKMNITVIPSGDVDGVSLWVNPDLDGDDGRYFEFKTSSYSSGEVKKILDATFTSFVKWFNSHSRPTRKN